MDLLEDLRMSLLNLDFVMIHIIDKVSVLIKSHLNHLKNNIFECFFKKHIRFLNFFLKKLFFSIIYNNRKKV